jgi:hypothetical protein
MNRWVGCFAIFLTASRLLFAANFTEWSDSGVYGPKYPELLRTLQNTQTNFSDIAQVIEYGVTPQKRALRLLYVKRPGNFLHRPTLLMTGSIHGNEYLNLEDRLPQELLKQSYSAGPVKKFLDDGGVFIFVPIVNPDGYESRSRDNAHGIDLNRDWDLTTAHFKGFKEAESKALSIEIERLRATDHLDFKITVDYHCCAGALLHPWAYKGESIPPSDLIRHKAIGAMAKRRLNIDVGATGQILGYYPVGTTKDYYYTRYGALAFTYEGRSHEENQYLSGHLSWWEDMVRSVNNEGTHPFIRFAMDAVNQARSLFQFAE